MFVAVIAPTECSTVELPTAIHLAAKYGFNELASKLIDLPDARYANGTTNVDGYYPEDLARAGRHDQLGTLFEHFREVVGPACCLL